MLVFARRLDEPTGRLLRALRDQIVERREAKLFGWLVVLGQTATASQTALERQAFEFARSHSVTGVPISVLGDPQGPPGYAIAADADLTLLVVRSGKVLYNRAYRAREWTPRAAETALADLPRLLNPAPTGRP